MGVVLVPDVLERTPPYVDEVRAGSPAEQAGIKADDLIVFVESLTDFRTNWKRSKGGEPTCK